MAARMAFSCRVTCYLPLATVLVHKHEDALKYLREAETYLESVEKGIPPEVLAKWLAEEAEWLSKVVDIRNHKTLDNPFVSPKDGSE